MFHVKHSD